MKTSGRLKSNEPEVSVAVIAGGLSERFGRPKARARLQGRELIDWALALAHRLSPRPFIVHTEVDHFSDKPVCKVADMVPRCGPIGGVYTALVHASTDWVALIPCDMPLLPVEIYHHLLQQRQENRPIVARSHKGLEPLVSVWPVVLKEELKTWIQQERYRLWRFLQQFNALSVAIPEEIPTYDPCWFWNVNFPEELRELEIYLKQAKSEPEKNQKNVEKFPPAPLK